MTDADAELPRPLPIRPRPMTSESTTSYIRRLARANHLRPSFLNRYLRSGPSADGSIRLDWLAALSGRYPTDLARALAEFRTEHPPTQASSPPADRTRSRPARTTLFNAIRRDAHANTALSMRSLSDRHGVHRRTIRAALNSPSPPSRKARAKRGSRLDPHQAVIDAMLTDRRGPKARVTIQQVYDRLVNEHQVTKTSYSAVRDYVSRRRQHLAQNSETGQIR